MIFSTQKWETDRGRVEWRGDVALRSHRQSLGVTGCSRDHPSQRLCAEGADLMQMFQLLSRGSGGSQDRGMVRTGMLTIMIPDANPGISLPSAFIGKQEITHVSCAAPPHQLLSQPIREGIRATSCGSKWPPKNIRKREKPRVEEA